VIRKPSIAPKQITTKRDKEALYHSKQYYGAALAEGDVDEFLATERETPRMYAARLIQDCTETRPEWYFQRRQIPRLDAEIVEYAGELWGHTQDLIVSRRESRWPRNSGACMLYGSPCKYLGICSGHDSIESGQWTTKEWVHPELPLIGITNGKDILTNSRIRTFQTCRQKHYLQYEVGIERIDAQEREALIFGLKLHEALEPYFLELREQQRTNNGNRNTDASVNGIEPSCAQEVFAD
jgi:PD-(D/E)XK nuclease superfamily protein